MSSYILNKTGKGRKGIFYTKMKIFRFRDKIDSLPESVGKIMPPIHIRIKPTNVCNHKCSYCAYKNDSLQLGKDMVAAHQIPREKMAEIVDDIVEIGVKSVTFSGGGEPFCYPYLLDAARKLSSTTVKFAALTNGSRLEGELAEIFAYKGTWLRVSIDGWDEKSYSAYRGVPEGEFSKVMKNMSNFKKLGGSCRLGISIVVDKKNTPHIYEFIKRLKGIGADNVKVSPCIVSNKGEENNRYHQSIFKEVKASIAKADRELADDGFEIFDAYHGLDEKFDKKYKWCPYLQVLPVIGADLNVYSCQDKAYNLDSGLIGSIKDKRFKEFWQTGKKKFFKIDPSKVCNHHCVANSKNNMILEYLDADMEHLAFV